MSATQTPIENDQPDTLRCTRCEAVLPKHATFCGQCGERVKKQGSETSSPDYRDVIERYRITSLVRRRPYTQLFFAFDNQQQQAVAINTANLSILEEEERARAIEAFQSQYDLLRRHPLPTIMRLVDLRYYQGHLYLIANWPRQDTNSQGRSRHLSTLFSLLQSGIGLPAEQVAIAWTYRLCRTLELLHKNNIVAGDIDPDTILVNDVNFESDPALMVSWLPGLLHTLLPHPSIDTNTAYFYAPETVIGESEPRSDIYSLGAILYLLLSGVTPKDAAERTRQPLASLREINPRINSTVDMVVMRALALEKEERYQSASDFSEALLQLDTNHHSVRSAQKSSPQRVQAVETQQDKEEIRISSPAADTTINEVGDKQASEAAEDATISVVPLQAQMARRYLSKIKTGKAETQGKQSGEVSVEEGLLQEVANGGNVPVDVDSTTDVEADYTPAEEHPADKDKAEPDEQAVMAIEAIEVQKERPIELHGEIQPIQDQHTIALEPLVKGEAEKDETGNGVREIEQMDTIPFKYHVMDTLDVHEQIKDQEERDQEAGANTRALQTQGTTSLQTQEPGKGLITERLKALFIKTATTRPDLAWLRELNVSKQLAGPKDGSLLKQVQHFLLGEPQNSTKAAALIETPLRIQPSQNYSIRINVIGRDKPTETQAAGLSALMRGEKVHIEVRSALYQNYAYIVQQADIEIPAEGYVAEITMPMQPLSGGPSGRRERLHIFFMDGANNPLYEKPFVIELFISHLVQSGREGHNVLSIPL